MKKKLQVFVSSTYIDLIEERQAAVQAVLDAGHIPAGMELFKAGNLSQLETIKKWIDNSDVYMLILGGRYGSVDPASGKSYTRLEYEYALQKGMPVFAVVLKDEFLFGKAAILGREKVFESDHTAEYESFKKLVMSKIVRKVDDAKDIKLAVHTTLLEFMEEYEMTGWVRSSCTEASGVVYKQIHQLMLENKELRKKREKLEHELSVNKEIFESCLVFEGTEIRITDGYPKDKDIIITLDVLFLLWAPCLLFTQNLTKAKKELDDALAIQFEKAFFSIDNNIFYTIRIRYQALGLIECYEKKNADGDTTVDITITEKGKNYYIQNTAVCKTK